MANGQAGNYGLPVGMAQSLRLAILRFDMALGRPRMERLSVPDAKALLRDVDEFYRCVNEIQALEEPQFDEDGMLILGPQSEVSVELEFLIIAGCRLAAELTEKIQMRLLDIEERASLSIDRMTQQWRTLVAEKQQATTLLRQAQDLRNASSHVTQDAGLGVFL